MPRLRLLLAGLLWVASPAAGPAWPAPPPHEAIRLAQSMEAEKNFFLEVMQLVARGQEGNAREVIAAKHELASQSFRVWLKAYANLKDEPQKKLVVSFLNLVAAVAEENGDPKLTATLKSKKLLASKARPAKPVDSRAADRELQALLALSARFGNYAATRRLARSTVQALERAGDPQLKKSLLMARFLEGAYEAFGGQPAEALTHLEPLVEEMTALNSAEFDFYIYAALVYAARRAALPAVVDRYLAPLGEAAQKVRTYKGGLYRFVAQTFSFERRWEQGKEPLDAARDCKAALKLLEGYTPEGDTTAEGRLFLEAMRFWVQVLDEDAGGRSQLKACLSSAQSLQQQSLRLSQEEYNPEFAQAALELKLDIIERERQRGELAQARSQLQEIGTVVGPLEKRLREADDDFAKATSRLGGGAESLKFSLLEGDFARLMVRYHQSWQRQIRAEQERAGGSESDLEQHLTAAEKYQELQTRGQGYPGLEDASWDRLAWLLRTRPKGWETSAQNLCLRALEINERLQYRPGLITALLFDAESWSAQGHKGPAVASLTRAVGLIEEYVAEVGGGGSRIRRRFQRVYDLLAQIQIEQGQGEEALSTLSRLQQVKSMMAARPETGGGGSGVAVLRDRSEALQRELVVRQSNKLDPGSAGRLLAENKAQFFLTLTELRRRNPRFESLLGVRPVNFSKLQRLIPVNAAVVQYFPADEALYVFVVTSTSLKIRQVPVTRADLYAQIVKFRRVVSVPTGDVRELSTALHALLIDPIDSDVADKEILAFVPTGALMYLPMPALARVHPEKGLEYLIERKQCVSLLKSADLEQLSQAPTPGQGGVLALGDPDGSLPAAGAEAAEVARTFPGSQSFVGLEARPEQLNPLAPGITYLHLATHGVLDSRDPAASYLALAGARLRIPQIYELKLDGLRLVTLSGCQTALGESDPGSEINSLADAFGVAGSNSVMASLWKVADESTRELMSAFYDNLKRGMPLSQAMQRAELKLLSQPATSHPFYWAPFTLMGDWR